MNACLNGLVTFPVVKQIVRNALNSIPMHLVGRSGKKYMYMYIEIGAISWVLKVHECMFKWSSDLPSG